MASPTRGSLNKSPFDGEPASLRTGGREIESPATFALPKSLRCFLSTASLASSSSCDGVATGFGDSCLLWLSSAHDPER